MKKLRTGAVFGIVVAVAACASPDAPPGTPAAEFDARVDAAGGNIPQATPTPEDPGEAEEEPALSPAPSTRPRLLGWLNPKVPGDVTAPVVVAAERPEGGDTSDTDTVAETPVLLATAEIAAKDASRGFAFRQPVSSDDAAIPVAVPAFGDIVPVCGLSRRDLGQEVARSDSGYRLYDSAPDSTTPRDQYLTGFADNCPRRLTAALVMFGSAAVHEATRYNPLNETPYSATDTAYEQVKARVCGVGSGTPCPERRLKRLERNSSFVSVYKSFGDSGEWLELFLHNGRLMGEELRGG